MIQISRNVQIIDQRRLQRPSKIFSGGERVFSRLLFPQPSGVVFQVSPPAEAVRHRDDGRRPCDLPVTWNSASAQRRRGHRASSSRRHRPAAAGKTKKPNEAVYFLLSRRTLRSIAHSIFCWYRVSRISRSGVCAQAIRRFAPSRATFFSTSS
jgi:hypothetical protein